MQDILRKLVSFHTTNGDDQSCHEALDYIASFLAQRNMHIERFDSNGAESLIATVVAGARTPKVLLAAHLDVLPGEDEQFDLYETDERLYGRGVLDMKFAIAAYMQLVDELQDRLADYDLGIMITTDEEVGGANGVQALIGEGYLPQVCVLPDGGDNWQIQTHAKGFVNVKLYYEGIPAHGSRPWLGKNAVWPLLPVLGEVKSQFPNADHQGTTCNLGMVSGGSSYNQVIDYAEALLDFRIAANSDKEPLLEKLNAICRPHGVKTELTGEGSVCEFRLDNPYIAPFVQAVQDITGITVRGSRTLGTSDARFFAAHNIPCISLYPTGQGHHGPEEWINKNAFYQFKKVLGRYLNEVARNA